MFAAPFSQLRVVRADPDVRGFPAESGSGNSGESPDKLAARTISDLIEESVKLEPLLS